jgi:TPR repeat protein
VNKVENKEKVNNSNSRRYQRYQEKVSYQKKRKAKPFIVIGVIILLLAIGAGIWYLDYRKENDIREQINNAKTGDAKAEYDLAVEYFNGVNVEADYKKGLKWLKKSVAQDYAEAMSLLGVYKLLGAADVTADLPGAVELFKGAAEQGNNDARIYLGDIYLTKDLEYYNPEEGLKFLNLAADEENVTALNLLGSLYKESEAVEQDYAKAAEYFQRAADLDDFESMYELGLLYMEGNGVTKDETKGAELIAAAAEGGNTSAQEYIANDGKEE